MEVRWADWEEWEDTSPALVQKELGTLEKLRKQEIIINLSFEMINSCHSQNIVVRGKASEHDVPDVQFLLLVITETRLFILFCVKIASCFNTTPLCYFKLVQEQEKNLAFHIIFWIYCFIRMQILMDNINYNIARCVRVRFWHRRMI